MASVWMGAAGHYDVVTDLTNSSDRVIACANRQIEIPFFYTVSLGPAIIICFTLAMNKKRKSYNQECCGGRPGVVVPLNLLDEFEHRWSYAAAFGAITNTLFSILTGFEGSVTRTVSSRSLKVLWSFWRAFEVCVNFFPFFACLYTENILLGSILGSAYAALWFSIKMWAMIDCANPVPELVPHLTVLSQTPTIICLGFLILKFLWNGFLYLRGRDKGSPLQRIEGSIVFPFQLEYVKELLRKPPPKVDWESKELGILEKLKAYYRRDLYDSRCHFKFSIRILCTVMIIVMGSYQMGVFQLYFSSVANQGLTELATSLINSSDLIPVNSTRTFKENVQSSLLLLRVSWFISTGFAYIISNLGLLGAISNYRTNLLSLFRGDRSFCPTKYRVKSPDYVSNSMKYSGYQIAYSIWGNIIMVFVFLVVSLLISFVLILPIMNNNWEPARFIFQYFLLPLIISMVIRLIQVLLAKYFFLQKKLSKDDEDLPLAIDNRRLYHVADYFLFVANVATGLFSCLMRIGKGLLVGLFYLSRLDRCVLMSGWERTDTGFTAYLGMLELEHAHNHPVMRVFCHLMTEIISDSGKSDSGCKDKMVLGESVASFNEKTGSPVSLRYCQVHPSTHEQKCDHIADSVPSKSESCITNLTCKKSREVQEAVGSHGISARQFWLLSYTLIRNPQLIPERHHEFTKHTSSQRLNPTLEDSIVYSQLKATLSAMEMNMQSKKEKTVPPELNIVQEDVDKNLLQSTTSDDVKKSYDSTPEAENKTEVTVDGLVQEEIDKMEIQGASDGDAQLECEIIIEKASTVESLETEAPLLQEVNNLNNQTVIEKDISKTNMEEFTDTGKIESASSIPKTSQAVSEDMSSLDHERQDFIRTLSNRNKVYDVNE